MGVRTPEQETDTFQEPAPGPPVAVVIVFGVVLFVINDENLCVKAGGGRQWCGRL